MNVLRTAMLVGATVLVATGALSASGPVGIYGIIERVVFEPNDQAPERVQLWGAFAFHDNSQSPASVSPASRGYLYFRLPAGSPGSDAAKIRTEWSDLKAVAGTNQAVAFGRWFYIGVFSALDPSRPFVTPMGIYAPSGGQRVDLHVRPASAPPADPIDYMTNAGVVKLPEASHGAVVKDLRDALRR